MTGSLFRFASPAIRLPLLVVASLAAWCAPRPAQAQTPVSAASAPRVAFEERLVDPPVLAAAREALGRAPGFPVMARIAVRLDDLEARDSGRAFRFDALERRLALYHDRKIPVWVALDAAMDTSNAPAASDKSARLFRALAPRLAGRVRVFEITLPNEALPPSTLDAFAFDIKRAALELRVADANITIALGIGPRQTLPDLDRLYAADLASYVDAIVVPAAADPAAQMLDGVRALLDRVDRRALVFERGRTLRGATEAAARAFVTTELWRLGSASALASYDGSAAHVRAALALAHAGGIQDLLAGDLTRLDDRTAQLSVTRADGQPVRAALLYDAATFGTYLIYADPSPLAPSRSTRAANDASTRDTVRVSLAIASDAPPRLRDPLAPSTSGTSSASASSSAIALSALSRDRATQQTTFVAPLLARPLIVDFDDALADRVTERSDVHGRARLSVREIIARHQQAHTRQDAALDHYTAAGRVEQHFRPTIADPGYDVVTENRFYVDRDGAEWEELSFSVNGSRWTANRPAFPLLQPEKVLSVPLTLRLSDDYTYRLTGTARIDDRECYTIDFDPLDTRQSLYRGTVWIDATTFVQRRLQTVQTKLSAPVVSNEETHHFASVAQLDGRDIVLPVRVVSRQIVLIAGRNMLVEKTSTFDRHRVNGDDFRERRQEARASDRIMYRDTPRGIRYYVKEKGQRVVSERSTSSAKAMAMGVTLDPSFDFPLPIFGINYLDFDFGGPDSQLALLFGGVLALGNVQRPKLLGTPLDGSVDFFAIAVPGSDRVYTEAGEREGERVLTWPISTGANVGYQFTSFQKLAAQYQFRFDGYVRDRTTAEDYRLPKSTTTHGLGLTYEYRRAGYSVAANGTWYGRARWAPWGMPDALQTSARTYEKVSLNVSKDWYVGLFQKIHANAAYFGGRRLDRFSQYQFGLFDDTRIHGVPASGVRMSELAMARGSYTFNLFEQYRVDLFLEQAVGRDRDGGAAAGWEPITGVGAALNVKGPWNTILRVDAGKSFLPDRYRTNGSTVVQILFLKPLK